jgi:hypothetical protein
MYCMNSRPTALGRNSSAEAAGKASMLASLSRHTANGPDVGARVV